MLGYWEKLGSFASLERLNYENNIPCLNDNDSLGVLYQIRSK